MTTCSPITIFDVSGTPRPKARARVTRNGTYTPKPTADWERRVGLCALLAGLRPHKDHVAVTIWLCGALHGDADNYGKAILDGLNGIAYEDDRQVVQIAVHLLRGRGALCRVLVERLADGWADEVTIPEVTT